MAGMAHKITDKIVKSSPAPSLIWDEDIKGFAIRVTAAGSRAFVLNYRRKSDGRERRWTIGSFPDWGTGAARDEAKRLKRLIDGGADPVGEQQSNRAAPTVNELLDRFEREYLPRKRASTQRTYRNQIKSAIRPKLGKLKVANVTFADIDALHRGLSEQTPYRANRVIALASRIFAMAIKWEMRSDNPVRGIERNEEQKRKRYLKGDELAQLTAALAAHRDQQAANIVRLLLLTGARRGELLAAMWDQFDLENGIWTKPGATTKQRTDHVVPLSAPTRQLLAELHKARDESGYLFPGRFGHRREIKDSWASICKTAGIKGLRAHDLRHSFASALAGAGFSLPIIGALLGHTQPSTTSRYAHLQDDPLRVATERAGAILSGQSSSSAEIVPFKGGKRA
jgi:integrase